MAVMFVAFKWDEWEYLLLCVLRVLRKFASRTGSVLI
jgi:hypothetical protein